jgi:GTP-binding protein
MFVDSVRVKLQAGKGGDGALSFRHEKFVDRGGPDGGDGGNGGDIILRASRNQDTLAAFRYKKLLKAESGQPGGKRKKHGKKGQDLKIDVPVGTVISDNTGNLLADFIQDGQTAVIAKGGRGGFGNAHFISSTRQAPRITEKGEQGDDFEAQMELKMIADVGLIGLPNAGKSTLLSVISNARPEIADYPFTTLNPHLGVVDIDGSTLLVADIPGLIEGASQGKGLGDEFLRHVERTKVLLHLIDIYSLDIVKDYRTIIKELKDYKIDLSKKPQLVALTKIEGVDKRDIDARLKELKKAVPRGTSLSAISSPSGAGVTELLRELKKRVDKAAKQPKAKKLRPSLPVITLRRDDTAWHLAKSDDGYIVTGKKIEKFARRTKFGDFYAEQRLRDIMRRMGISHELQRQGAKAGQAISIGSPEIGRLEY